MPHPTLSQHESRRTVKQHRDVGDLDAWSSKVLREAARQHKLTSRLARMVLGGPKIPLVDRLKMAEYALLVDPISEGVRRFIDQPGLPNPGSEQITRHSFVSKAGLQVYWNVDKSLVENPGKRRVEELIRARSKLLPKGQARAISPLDWALREAATSSVHVMFTSAVANALTAQRAMGSDASYFEVMEATRNSTQFPLSRPLIHLFGQRNVYENVEDYNATLKRGEKPEVDILRFDHDTNRVVLASRLRSMDGSNGRLDIDNEKVVDTEIGCPITFSSGLVKDYYLTIVDLMEVYELWPQRIYGAESAPKIGDLSQQ